MSLYKEWSDMVVNYVKSQGEAAFWNEYSSIEEKIYTKVLANHEKNISGTIKKLSEEFEVSTIYVMGFLDGINDSLVESLDLEQVNEDTEIDVKVDLEKLYFNMLDAKADYLYGLPQWEGIFSKEKRKEIHDSWAATKTVTNEHKIGRNDPCPCGSGKKYKKCCGKNK